jgi:hypothetical protein
MAAQAAHLVDCILPAVAIRQFVLSFPFELSLLAATKPEVLRALARIHAEELARHYKQTAKKSGEGGKLHAGAVTFVQRFGSSLNLHVHLHTCALDGVYVEGEEGEAPRFVPATPPSRAELYVLTERVALRVMTWLRKRGHAKDDEHASNDTPDRTFAEVLAQLAMQRGTVENVKDNTGESEGPSAHGLSRERGFVHDARVERRRSASRGRNRVEGPPGDVEVGDDGAHLEPAAATGASEQHIIETSTSTPV